MCASAPTPRRMMVDSLTPPSAAMLALALAGNDARKANGALEQVEPPGVAAGFAGPASAGARAPVRGHGALAHRARVVGSICCVT